jgi:hypothetical protein
MIPFAEGGVRGLPCAGEVKPTERQGFDQSGPAARLVAAASRPLVFRKAIP